MSCDDRNMFIVEATVVEFGFNKKKFNQVKTNSQSEFKVDLSKILFPHMMGGASGINV